VAKRILFILFLLIVIKVSGQDEGESFSAYDLERTSFPEQPSLILKTNPGTILIGPIIYTSEYRIVAEVPVNVHYGVQVALSYLGKNLILSELLESDTVYNGLPVKNMLFYVSGFRFQLTYKRYILESLFGKAPFGMYVALHYSLSRAKITLDPYNLYRTFFLSHFENYDLVLGEQFNIKFFNWDNLVVDVFAGLGYKSNLFMLYDRGKPVSTSYKPYWQIPVKIVLGFNAGISF